MQSEGMTKPQMQRLRLTFTLHDLQSDHHSLYGLRHAGYVKTNWAGSSFTTREIPTSDFPPN